LLAGDGDKVEHLLRKTEKHEKKDRNRKTDKQY
jgi:hypothetical protein